jgi:hypothetical protein
MKGPVSLRREVESVDPTPAEPMALGALVHQVFNSTAAIRFSASALRTGGALGEADLAELARIEEAAAMVGRIVKAFASTAELVPAAPAEERIIDLYDVCCELAEHWRVSEGRPVYCRASGDPRGRWDRQELVAYLSSLMEVAVHGLPPGGLLNVAVTGLGRHVRLDLHGLGAMSPETQHECLEKTSGMSGPLGSMLTVKVTRTAGTTLSLRLPR